MSKIYTKTGDQGTTSLYSGERVSKTHELIHAAGTLDECNSLIGFCISLLRRDLQEEPCFELEQLLAELEQVQCHLFSVGAHVATPRGLGDSEREQRTRISSEPASQLEQWIDRWQEQLVPLNHFILPGGHWIAAALHHARCECRHAERHICPLLEQGLIERHAFEFINRLSDYLFVIARLVNHLKGISETAWKSSQRGTP